MINGRNYSDQLVKSDIWSCENIRKTTTGQGDDYTTDCLFDHLYFKEKYMLIAIYISKQKALTADSKSIL